MIAPKQGDIYLVTLDPIIGTEMAKTRGNQSIFTNTFCVVRDFGIGYGVSET